MGGRLRLLLDKKGHCKMKRWVGGLIAGVSGAMTLCATATAFAHVIVTPAQSTVGAWEQYSMRVPCEKTDPTVQIVLKIPAGMDFEQYEPVQGWTVHEQKLSDGTETVTWQATGAGIQPGQFETFQFIAQNPNKPTTLDWNAFQRYKDNTIVEWTGPADSSTPHSMTQILTSQPVSQAAAPTSAAQTAAAAPGNSLGWSTADTWVLTVSIVAILLSGLALGFSLIGGGHDKEKE
jgi:uncharacterized protein YcnI